MVSTILERQGHLRDQNQTMCEALHQRKVEVLVAPTVRAWGTTCDFVLSDGTVEQRVFDTIILCHGYRKLFTWLKAPVSTDPRDWFLHCFPLGMGHCLFFVGSASRVYSLHSRGAFAVHRVAFGWAQKPPGRLCISGPRQPAV